MACTLSVTAAIAAGASQSSVIDTERSALSGIIMPAAWTAADLTVLASTHEEGTFLPVYDDAGAEVVIKAAASIAIGIDAAALKIAAFRYIKLRSGTVATPVNQADARALTIVMKG